MICYVLAMGKQHLGPHVVVGYGIKFFGRAFSLRHQITWNALSIRLRKIFSDSANGMKRTRKSATDVVDMRNKGKV